MGLKFNINRPPVSEEEIKKHQDFESLVNKFKEQSIKQARGDESWWKNKKIRYSAIIAGVTVFCTVTYISISNKNKTPETTHDKIITLSTGSEKNKKNPRAFVVPPVAKARPAYTSYSVNSGKGGTITHNNATTLRIPKNAFVDKNGKDVVGEVTIDYREIHDEADVILSGVPMRYDSAGQVFNLETAGMFDIAGSQNGEPVFIRNGQPITVVLASNTAEDKFNQYYLDTIARNWQYIKRDNPVVNASKVVAHKPAANKTAQRILQLEKEIGTIIPRKKDSVSALYNRRIAKLPVPVAPVKPNPASAGRPSFKLDGKFEEFPELSAFDNVTFEVGPENRNYSGEFHEITWSDIRISEGPVKGVNYMLTLSHRQRTEKLVVYPVLKMEDYVKAKKRFEAGFEKYKDLLQERSDKEAKLKKELEEKQLAYLLEKQKKEDELKAERIKMAQGVDFLAQQDLKANFSSMNAQTKAQRIFEVNKFGIYNSDCPHAATGSGSIHARFQDEKNKKISPDVVYLVNHTKKTVYMYSRDEIKSISYDLSQEYTFCIFRNNSLYVCDRQNVKEALEGGKSDFTAHAASDEALHPAGLRKILGL